MVSTSKTIVISGYYGFKNSGDEAVLKSILTALEEQGKAAGIMIEPVVLSIDPEWTSKMYGVRSVHRMQLGEVRRAIKESDGLISGGGSLLQDATSPKTIPYYLAIIKMAQWLRKPTFVYAQGVGPVNRKIFNPMIRSVFRKCSYISVRDVQSGELLQSMGIRAEDIHVVPDPVMGLPLPEGITSVDQSLVDQADGDASVEGSLLEDNDVEMEAADEAIKQHNGELPVIGISVRFWDPERRELNAIADGLKELMRKRPVHLRFLPFHKPDDEEASRYITDRMGDITSYGGVISFYREEQQPQDMLREVSRCQLILGMRLHSLIYAANQRVPLIGISYDPKIDHFLNRLHSAAIGSSESLVPADLTRHMTTLLDGSKAWKEEHEAQIAQLKLEAQLPARHIVEYLGNRR
ncbi:polysaccharide pyruvyl transferase CsaB [Paenibacillus uliginis N3/975]|uniref:Polysaccharide pyruvyl transferase CsaB n=1 Tax=Paenibacillus uliginis N3/975 TaxID=1313296 RepID=A0A1X7GB27_9BACL|nr:polysaccharide pyruvyl transferase CsaB [Paenibacillus uliginis]SMF67018.1 polysaccharide pyruvyl transferase CsaB [Paenibacillus uliginis N3/975]